MSLLRSRRSAHADIAVFIADAKVPGGTSGLRSTSDHEPMGIFEEQIDIWSFVFRCELPWPTCFTRSCHKCTVIRQQSILSSA